MTAIYNDPAGGSPSSVGSQIRTDSYIKEALFEARELEYFGPLADNKVMPKNMGKKLKLFHYMPMLSDRNINDQGIDAAGVSTANKVTITVVNPDLTNDDGEYITLFAVGTGVDAAAALGATTVGYASTSAADLASARWKAWKLLVTALDLDGSLAVNDTYAEVKAIAEGLDPSWTITETGAVNGAGNLYGSSKDIGLLTATFPALTENGGTVNRVGITRIEIEGTFARYGFYRSYTKESEDFDTDADLERHYTREIINGAMEMQEDQLQVDILNAAGVIKYGGEAVSVATISGEVGSVSLPTTEDFNKLDTILTNNKSPKTTKMITGSRMEDTVTVRGGRLMYVGSEISNMLRKLTDKWGNAAFKEAHHYAAATTLVRGEIGMIGPFRIIEVPKMLHWAGVGAAVSNNAGYRESGGKYNVYPMLVVGDNSFSTISFKTGKGRGNKFETYHSKPKSAVSRANDFYGSKGFFVIEYYYGVMVLRPERIAIIKTVAEL